MDIEWSNTWIFVKHLKCIKMCRSRLESILITMYIFLVSTEIIEYIVVIMQRSPGIWNV